MKSVNIAAFKAELSKYLGYVRKGEEILVLDRKEPLAKVSPARGSDLEKIVVEKAENEAADLFLLKSKPLPSMTTDSLRFLKEERSER